jgi:hypothetical protein
MKNITDSGLSFVSGVNPLDAFYENHGKKGEVPFLSSALNTIRVVNR